MFSPGGRSRVPLLGALLCGVALASLPSRAEITIGIDAESLNELLPALTAREVTVPLGEGRTIRVLLENLRITGFDPAAGEGGQILTSVRLRAPQLGLDVQMAPKLSVRVAQHDSAHEIELTFAEAALALPLGGTINLAPLLEPIRFPADGIFQLAGADGNVDVESKLSEVKMGAKVLRFALEVKARPAAAPTSR